MVFSKAEAGASKDFRGNLDDRDFPLLPSRGIQVFQLGKSARPIVVGICEFSESCISV